MFYILTKHLEKLGKDMIVWEHVELYFSRRYNTRVGLKFHRLVAKIIKVSLGIKISGYSIFRVLVSEKK